MRLFRYLLLLPAAVLASPRQLGAGHVSVAAAANLVYVMEPLNAAFTRAAPDVDVTSEVGASGGLVAQIQNGAPYDVFLSADTDYPKKLVKAGGAVADSLVVFAKGRLVLWTFKPAVDLSSVSLAVGAAAAGKIAVANPETAPYGRAAVEALGRLGIADAVRPKLVYGENISQTAQFVSSGNADLGFVALSLVLSPKLKDKGRWLEVPAELYTPILQAGVLTKRGALNPDARRYLEFLSSPEAKAILARFGYGAP